jgi:hypothetical protein
LSGAIKNTTGSFRFEIPSGQARIIVFSHIADQMVTRLASLDSARQVLLNILIVERGTPASRVQVET